VEGVSVVSAVDQGITTTDREKENTTDRGGLRMQGNAMKYLMTTTTAPTKSLYTTTNTTVPVQGNAKMQIQTWQEEEERSDRG
jgi:hypothetical protein